MPEIDEDQTLEPDGEQEPKDGEDLKELRAAANRTKKAQNEAAEAKRELAMHKAGVDLDTKLGQTFAKAYDGEIDVEAIRSEWHELAPPAEGQEQVPSTERGATDERSALATGAAVDLPVGADPRVEAIEHARKVVAEGASSEFGLALAASDLIKAGMAGDTRVVKSVADG